MWGQFFYEALEDATQTINKTISMLSKTIINYLKENKFLSRKKKKKNYTKALLDLGINLNSDLAYFCLHTTEMSFKGRIWQY